MITRQQRANAIRFLAMDAVQRANSGHPGMPMGMADIAEVLWHDVLAHNPVNPHWANRDRFILSNGHGSMLQYALLYLTGYELSIDDIKNFRQLHSITPGHPEHGETPGVETTTGPLGQGLANAVGMALAERTLAAQFNRPHFPIIDHMTYVFTGDGCLMEGISHEVCSLAGTLGLGKLIMFYDDNGISIDGQVKHWFQDNTAQRFSAYHWHVVDNVDGHDPLAIEKALREAKNITDKPSIIICKTIIGYGAPTKAGSHKTHGAPLGDAEIQATREKLAWNYPPFVVPDDIKQSWDARERGLALEEQWNNLFEQYAAEYPELASELTRRLSSTLPEDWQTLIEKHIQSCLNNSAVATRKASQNTLNAMAPHLPELFGGSADLTDSNLTLWKDAKPILNKDIDGHYLFYGVREFGMSSMMNGIALHGGFIPFGGTFLVFCDYARNAVRLSALMKAHVIYVYTHDSIGLGEDGPTHQPIEHITMLRATPGISVWRPCDSVETAIAWRYAIENCDGPTALLLTRQTVPSQQHETNTLENIEKGAYILKDCAGEPELIFIATGSEVDLAIQAYQHLSAQERRIRVVSMPSTDCFAKQPKEYRESVLPSHIRKRVAIEAGATDFWYKYVGLEGKIIGIDHFGFSAPAEQVFAECQLTIEHVLEVVNQLL